VIQKADRELLLKKVVDASGVKRFSLDFTSERFIMPEGSSNVAMFEMLCSLTTRCVRGRYTMRTPASSNVMTEMYRMTVYSFVLCMINDDKDTSENLSLQGFSRCMQIFIRSYCH